MGLDQYLYAERVLTDDEAEQVFSATGLSYADVVAANTPDEDGWCEGVYLSAWSHGNPEDAAVYRSVLDVSGLGSTEDVPSLHILLREGKVTVQSTVAYWRKANAIHAWFVDECQDGVDECQTSEVHPEQLAALRSTCEKALAAYEAGDLEGAEEILPPRSGFFFGSTDVDEWWAEDLRRTITAIERVIGDAIAAPGLVTFAYHASW
jgi:hypothetical protein